MDFKHEFAQFFFSFDSFYFAISDYSLFMQPFHFTLFSFYHLTRLYNERLFISLMELLRAPV